MITFFNIHIFLFFFIATAVIIASIAAFLLSLLYKWGGVEYMQVHGNDFVSKLASCDFCLSWWSCVIVAFTAFLATGESALLFTPLVATKFAQKLI